MPNPGEKKRNVFGVWLNTSVNRLAKTGTPLILFGPITPAAELLYTRPSFLEETLKVSKR